MSKVHRYLHNSIESLSPWIASLILGKHWTVSELMKNWGEVIYRGQYMSEFNCFTSFCEEFIKTIRLPRYFYGTSQPISTNFLLGGPGSGLPFHSHSKTYQLLIAGIKRWYLVPPGKMSAKMAEVVGPYLFPAEAWTRAVSGLPIGERPLRCAQYPGEIIFFPDDWWHATANAGDYTLAYGEKPVSKMTTQHPPSVAYQQMVAMFKEDEGKGPLSHGCRAWYDVICHTKDIEVIGTGKGSYKHRTLKAFLEKIDAPLAKMHVAAVKAAQSSATSRSLQYGKEEVRLLAETAAFAYCVFREKVLKNTMLKMEGNWTNMWNENAKILSRRIHNLQCV